ENKEPVAWEEYKAWLASQGIPLTDALAERGLSAEDIPGWERLGRADEETDVRLSGGAQSEGFERGNQPDRVLGTGEGPAVGGSVERPGEDVGVRPGDSGGP